MNHYLQYLGCQTPDLIVPHIDTSDEDNFSQEPLTPELSEASFARKTIVAVKTPEKPWFSRLARSLLLKL
jgi:hypothetical protein